MTTSVATASVFARAAAECGSFIAWWAQELRDACTSFMQHVAPQRAQRYTLDVSAARGSLARNGGEPAPQLQFEIHDGRLPELREVWAGAGVAPRTAHVSIALPSAAVLVFQLQLPPLGEREVEGAVALQLERKLPLPKQQIYIDWRIAEKLPDRSRIVDVAIARRSDVMHWRDELRNWGWRIRSIGCRDASGQLQFNLLPSPVPRLNLAFGRRERWLAYGTLALCAAYLLTVIGQWSYERLSLREQVAQAQIEVAKVEELRTRLEKEMKPVASLLQLMKAPAADRTLAIMSNAMPRDAWLYQTDIQSAADAPVTVSLEGYTSSATTLVQALEQSRQFANVQLLEVVTSDPATGRERVKLKASMYGGGP